MNQIGSYLSSESFSDHVLYRPRIICHPQLRGRVMAQWVAGRRRLRVCFADQVPLIANCRADGRWLHVRLGRSASACLGVDINPQAVVMAGGVGFENVHELDVLAPKAATTLAGWRVGLEQVPDVIEHVLYPATFMQLHSNKVFP